MLSYNSGNIRNRILTLHKDISKQLAVFERKVLSRIFEKIELN